MKMDMSVKPLPEKKHISERPKIWSCFICILGGFLIQLTLGSYYSFANIMPYMVSYMRKHSQDHNLTYGDFITVQSAWGFTQGLILPVSGCVISLIGPIVAVLLGSILFGAAPIITAYTISTTLWQVVFSYGVLSSIGQNLAILPTLTVPMKFFPESQGLVSGLIVSGFGMGAFLFNQVQTHIVNPDDVAVDQESGYFTDEDILQRVPLLLEWLGLIYSAMLFIGAVMLFIRLPCANSEPFSANTPSFQLQSQTPWTFFTIATSRPFILLWLTRVGMVLISQSVSGFYKAYALEHLHYGDEFTSLTGAIAGVFNCIGRVTIGCLTDYLPYKRVMCIEALLVLILLLSWPWTASASQLSFAICLWMIFLCLPGVFAMHPAVCNKIFGGPGKRNNDSVAFAIGLIGSADIVSNSLIGAFSDTILKVLNWTGFFLVVSSFAAFVFVITLFFPDERSQQIDCKKGTRV